MHPSRLSSLDSDTHQHYQRTPMRVDYKHQDVKVEGGDKVIRDCTHMAAVKAHFVDIALVFVRPPGYPPHPLFHGHLCSCVGFARYAGCEHVEFCNMLDLRLNTASSLPHTLPTQAVRVRKPGQTLTLRGAAKAKATPKGHAKGRGRSAKAKASPKMLSAPIR